MPSTPAASVTLLEGADVQGQQEFLEHLWRAGISAPALSCRSGVLLFRFLGGRKTFCLDFFVKTIMRHVEFRTAMKIVPSGLCQLLVNLLEV